MAEMKWHGELDIFRKIKPCIVLEGNIFDRFHYDCEPANKMRELPSYVMRLLADAGYETIVFYDEANGFYGDGYGDDLERLGEFCKDVPGIKVADGRIPCSFTNGGKGPAMGDILNTVLNQCEHATAVIMDMASRYIVSPDNMEMCEVSAYTNVLRAIRKAQSVQVNEEYTKNIVILLVNKVNDLPTWFYLHNPDVKTIHIPTPDNHARMEFVSGDNLEAFFAADVWAQDRPATVEDQARLIKLQKRFVGMTDGFTYTDLVGMRTLCRNEKYRLSQLPSVVEFYRYGVRENKWSQVSKNTVQDLENALHSRVLGQDRAIDKVMDVVKRSVVQKSASNRPRGVLFFAGPTGTGKTETAKVLAESIFGDESCCIRFDMSEYRQDHSDQKLLGAPPGYVGYEAGGQLTNAVRENPFSIILFDEIEKAHPSILDKFLQILDDGRLTDGQGNTVYFSEAIIIFTSNKGIIEQVEEVDDFGIPRVSNKQVVDPKVDSPEAVQKKVIESIKNYFKFTLSRPELLNRIGENNIVVYDFIREPVAEGILSKQISDYSKMIKGDLDISIEILDSAVSNLLTMIRESSVLENGGRGIRNLVESMLYTPLTRFIYDNDVQHGGTVTVSTIQCDATGAVTLSAEVS